MCHIWRLGYISALAGGWSYPQFCPQGNPKTVQSLEGWAWLWLRINPAFSLSLLDLFEVLLAWSRGLSVIHSSEDQTKWGKKAQHKQKKSRQVWRKLTLHGVV